MVKTYYVMVKFWLIEQSNRTPRCSQEVSAAGILCLEHFGVQCYTKVKSLLVAFRENAIQPQDLDIVLQIYLK